MKKTLIIALTIIVLASCLRNRTVELPLTMRDGYGPFKTTSMGGISPDSSDPTSPWYKSRTQISRLPEGLIEVKSGAIETNIYQHVYQHYLAGNITKEWYENLQKSWNWIPYTAMLSQKQIRTKIAFAYGKDTEGTMKFILDVNGNFDLSDDTAFMPVDMAAIEEITNKDSLAQVYTTRVSIETFVNDRIESVEVPLLITYHAAYNMFFNNFARYATITYRGQEIAINSSAFGDLRQ